MNRQDLCRSDALQINDTRRDFKLNVYHSVIFLSQWAPLFSCD